jgi:hypothetical protein
MTISCACPLCGFSASIPNEYKGRRIKCPKCDHSFVGPEKTQAALPAPLPEPCPTTESASSSLSCPKAP